MPAALTAHVTEAPPVHLALLSGRCLEPYRRLRLPGLPPRTHIVGHRRVPAVIAQLPDLSQQHPAVLQTLGEPLIDVVGVRVQLGTPQRAGLRPDRLRRPQVTQHRVAGYAQLPGDRSSRKSLTLQIVYLLHFSTS